MSGTDTRASSAASPAVRTTVMRIVFAWKKAQRFEASTLSLSAFVCELFASVSPKARNNAKMEIRSATPLVEPSKPCSP